jgi:hypothetical protein
MGTLHFTIVKPIPSQKVASLLLLISIVNHRDTGLHRELNLPHSYLSVSLRVSVVILKMENLSMRQSSEANEHPKQTPESSWNAILEDAPAQRPSFSTLLTGWDRFNVRHLLLWMAGIAFSIGAFRCFKAMRLAVPVPSSFFESWFLVSLDFDDYVNAIAVGSILGVGIPAVLTGPPNSKFSEHPARVVFALFIALATLKLAEHFTGVDSLLGMAGIAATGFVWSLYALVRPKIRWAWRWALLLVCFACAWDFYFVCQIVLMTSQLTTGGLSPMVRYTPFSIVEQYALVATLLGAGIIISIGLAGILEIARGRFKDWRTWTVMFIIPISVLLNATPLLYQILRSYQLQQPIGL